MSFSRELPIPIILSDGRRIATLQETAEFVLMLAAASSNRDEWELVSDLLMTASADDTSDAALVALNEELTIALDAEGLIERSNPPLRRRSG